MEEDRIVDIKRKNKNLLDRIAHQMVNIPITQSNYRKQRLKRTLILF
jgi:hypothetical protein